MSDPGTGSTGRAAGGEDGRRPAGAEDAGRAAEAEDGGRAAEAEDGGRAAIAEHAVRLRPTMTSDLDFVISVEQDPANLPFITPWDRTQHEGAIRFPDFRHFVVEAGAGYPSVGFVILQGCRNMHRSIELKRMVLRPDMHGIGIGRVCIRLLAQMAFRDLGAHRFWLDVKARNLRAQALYKSEGFVEEGRLRESVRTGDGYDSLIVMSILEHEHEHGREHDKRSLTEK